MKKKNMAIMMAGVTVATTVAPAFAAPQTRAVVESTQEQEIKAIKEKVASLIAKKYTKQENLLKTDDLAGTNVYTIKLSLVDEEGTLVPNTEETATSFADFERKFDAKFEELKDGQNLKVEYAENAAGHRVLENGQIVDFVEEKYTKDEIQAMTTSSDVTTPGSLKVTTAVDGSKKVEVVLSEVVDGEERTVEIKAGETKLDLTKPVYRQVNGYYVDKTGKSIQKVEDNDDFAINALANGVVDGFFAKQVEIAAEDKEGTTNDVIVKTGFKKVELNASELYNVEEGRLTKLGTDVTREINAAKADEKYTVSNNTDGDIITITEVKTGDKLAEVKIVKDAADKKGEAFAFMKKFILGTARPEIEVVAGDDRYKTAVEVSKTGWQSGSKDVVLVAGTNDALVDGLTATPLAALLNTNGAPILLSGKTSIDQSVIDEMERLGAKNVYIVGGAISEDVESLLTNKYGFNVERIAGDSRYETSLKVAEKVDTLNGSVTGSFLVGGRAEADALSASAIAGQMKMPIILTQANAMSTEVKEAVKTAAGNVTIVGGDNSVSDDVVKQLIDMKITNERLSGTDRNETNASVLKKFYTTEEDAVIIAKSGNAGLVDALSAGALGAKNGAPVVLTGAELTETQKEAVEAIVRADSADTNDGTLKVQIGNGIAAAVVKFIKGL